jgi:hypothetical protein
MAIDGALEQEDVGFLAVLRMPSSVSSAARSLTTRGAAVRAAATAARRPSRW